MTYQWRRMMTSLGFLACVAMVAPSCVVRGSAQVRTKPAYVVDESPPAPRYRKDVRSRDGYVWIRGRWTWQANSWVWVDGHWERDRKGYNYRDGRWEKRGNRWHWIEGSWVVVSNSGSHSPPAQRRPSPQRPDESRRPSPHAGYPTEAPPAPKVVKRPRRAGYVWVRGHWDWRSGDWVWVDGHWERERASYEWEHGRWERQGDRYVWIEGRWVKRGGSGGVVRTPRRSGPTSPPPAPKGKRPGKRAGYVWITGHWEWRNDDYVWIEGHWERARRDQSWQSGEWVLQNGVYVWIEGKWVPAQQRGPRVRDHRQR